MKSKIKNSIYLYKFNKKSYNLMNLLFGFPSLFGPKEYARNPIPSFDKIDDKLIKLYSGINPKWTYRNHIFWTPRFYLQKDISQEFLFQLKKFRKINEWENIHQVALIQLVLTEAIRDTTYEIEYNYRINPTLQNPFHGLIDMLIYNNDENSK
jgi:hypothetical protein